MLFLCSYNFKPSPQLVKSPSALIIGIVTSILGHKGVTYAF